MAKIIKMKTEKYTTKMIGTEADFSLEKKGFDKQVFELFHDPDFDHITTWLIDESTYLKIQETKKGGE